MDENGTGLCGTIHPDEIDIDDDVNDMDEGNENLQRLQEILGDADDSDDDDDDDDVMSDASDEGKCVQHELNESSLSVREIMMLLNSMSWKMSHSKRLETIRLIMQSTIVLLNTLRTKCLPLVASARRNYSQAKGISFRHARVVGATVVGASRRLEAIRAAEPFAIVVEEACEVMEPALMSVIAVKSLKKLELVGDHRCV